jgi:hypothetical protein
MTRELRARGVAVDGVVRSPRSTVLATAAICLIMVGAAVAVAVWNHLAPDVYAEWLTDGIAVIAIVISFYTVVALARSRTILHQDRIELIGIFRRSEVRRDGIVGYRSGHGLITLCRRPGAGRDILVTDEVVMNPLWLAWLESLPNLDERDALNAQVTLEVDPRLGHTPSQRREALGVLGKWAGWLDTFGVALAGWTIFWPRPYEAALIVSGVTPVVTLLLLARWRGLLSLIDESRGPSLNTFWMLPMLAVGIRGMNDVEMIDWHEPLMVAAGVAVVFAALVWWLDTRGRSFLGAIFPGFVALAWAWGVVVMVDVIPDLAPARRIPARVVDVSGKDNKLTVTLEALAPPHERFEDFDLTKRQHRLAKVGAQTCVVVYPGRLGWRYGHVGACKR